MTKLNNDALIKSVEDEILGENIPKIQVGDMIRIGSTIVEGNKERVQYFQGNVISKKNSRINLTINVRRIVEGIGMERIFLIHSPKIVSFEIFRSSKVRRSKLYYLRGLKGKAGRLKQKGQAKVKSIFTKKKK